MIIILKKKKKNQQRLITGQETQAGLSWVMRKPVFQAEKVWGNSDSKPQET